MENAPPMLLGVIIDHTTKYKWTEYNFLLWFPIYLNSACFMLWVRLNISESKLLPKFYSWPLNNLGVRGTDYQAVENLGITWVRPPQMQLPNRKLKMLNLKSPERDLVNKARLSFWNDFKKEISIHYSLWNRWFLLNFVKKRASKPVMFSLKPTTFVFYTAKS